MAVPSPNLPPVLSDAIRVNLVGLNSTGDKWRTHIDYVPTGPSTNFTTNDLTAFNTAWRAACLVAFRDCMDDGATVEAVSTESRKLAAQFPVNVSVSAPGNVTGDCLPPYCAVSIRFQTLTRGKKGRGRSQMPAVPETFQNNGTLISAGLTAYNDYIATIVGPIAINATNVVSLIVGVTKRDTYDPVTGIWALRADGVSTISLASVLGTQLSRKKFRGE